MVSQTRSLERLLEDAQLSGDLLLVGRKLKEFPQTGKYDLLDTVFADLSRNRFSELPRKLTEFWYLEKVLLNQNVIRNIPQSVVNLQSLVYLDMSRNQLSELPVTLCQLPLEILLLSHNRLQAVPPELGRCSTLMELDLSNNQMTNIHPQLGQLNALRSLNVRNNLILELPLELTYLKLVHLDISMNRIASLPLELRNMTTLETFKVSENPLVAPPAAICVRGRVHIFKWLELRSSKDERRGAAGGPGTPARGVRRMYRPTGDDVSVASLWSTASSPVADSACSLNLSKSGRSSSEREIYGGAKLKTALGGIGSMSGNNVKNAASTSVIDEKKVSPVQVSHPQTYREYKEQLRQQRTMEATVYRPREDGQQVNPDVKKPVPVVVVNPSTRTPSQLDTDEVKNMAATNVESHISPAVSVVTKSFTQPRATKEVPTRSLPWQRERDHQFTMKREYDKAKEEAELVATLKKNIESRLKITLPDNLAEALKDGVALCQFLNSLHPRSITSIHLPSPGVEKLSMARCRRNVDNFLDVCRKIGVHEDLLSLIRRYRQETGLLPLLPLAALVLAISHPVTSIDILPQSSSSVQKHVSTILCLAVFSLVNLLLYFYPPPP